jgi:hypothetical protein
MQHSDYIFFPAGLWSHTQKKVQSTHSPSLIIAGGQCVGAALINGAPLVRKLAPPAPPHANLRGRVRLTKCVKLAKCVLSYKPRTPDGTY